jgi:Zn-dependent protease
MVDKELTNILLMVPGVLIGFTVHEVSHAFLAVLLGDSTPKDQGRLTLNPIAHIDIMGLVLILIAGFGWAKPVQINSKNFKNPRGDEILVSIVGPLSNIVFAVIMTGLVKLLVTYAGGIFYSEGFGNKFFHALVLVVYINILLAVFNMIPVPPLDGSHILLCLISDRYYRFKAAYQRFGRFFLLAIILLSRFSGRSLLPIGFVTNSILSALFRAVGMH